MNAYIRPSQIRFAVSEDHMSEVSLEDWAYAKEDQINGLLQITSQLKRERIYLAVILIAALVFYCAFQFPI
jgi:hypothetical protein